jgi:hypothetical protein
VPVRAAITSAGELAASASAAASAASAWLTERITFLISARPECDTESESIPSPIRRKAPSGCEASSPQTPTSIPASRPARATGAIRRTTAGWKGVYRGASRELPRSTARVYCTRSLVPMEKKSTCRASSGASSAAAGVSIMAPTGTRSGMACPSARSACALSAISARVCSTSEISLMSGSMIRTSPWAAARRRARSCPRKISGSSRQTRIARHPRKGFSSRPMCRKAGNLSPPRS